MIQFLIRHFVPDHEQTQQPQVRQRYGVLACLLYTSDAADEL